MEVPARIRTSVNVLLCLAAIAGTGWSGTVLWDEWRTYRAVGAGCADLVPIDEVRGMDYADPVLRNRGSLDLDSLPSDCLIQNAGDDGNAYGAWLFQAMVDAGPDSGRDVIVSRPSSELPERFERLEVPLGNGVSGLAGPSQATVRLDCPDGTYEGEQADRIEVTASAAYTGMSSYYPKPATSGDRIRMASVAVSAANNLAEKLGCAQRLNAPDLVAVPRFTSDEHTEGTCAWYKPLEQAAIHVKWLPDEVMSAPVDQHAWRERCALRLDEERWADVQTFYGQDSPDVYIGSTGSTKATDRPIVPGTAGRDTDSTLWWATSDCAGIPAVHVLRVDYGARSLRAAPHFEQLFRAYVTDVATRRGCTGLEFPTGSDFSAEGA